MAMNDTTVSVPDTTEPTRPLRLAARSQPAVQVLARRVMPDAIPDDGMAPLDVAGFTSAI